MEYNGWGTLLRPENKAKNGKEKGFDKGTVHVISSDPQLIKWHVRFMRVPFRIPSMIKSELDFHDLLLKTDHFHLWI